MAVTLRVNRDANLDTVEKLAVAVAHEVVSEADVGGCFLTKVRLLRRSWSCECARRMQRAATGCARRYWRSWASGSRMRAWQFGTERPSFS